MLVVRVDGAFTRGMNELITPVNTASNAGFSIQNWALEGTVPVTAGQHTITVSAVGTGVGNSAVVSGDPASAAVGTLTVTILNT